MRNRKIVLSGISAVLIFSVTILVGCKKELPAPIACFTIDKDTVHVYEPVTITNCSQNADLVTWVFGDDQIGGGNSTSNWYSTPDTYIISMTARQTESGVVDTKTMPVYVLPCPLGYDGANCATVSRDKFLGVYKVREAVFSSGTSADTFSVTVSPGPDINTILIDNMHKVSGSAVLVNVVNVYRLVINSQQFAGTNSRISGKTMGQNAIAFFFNYTISDSTVSPPVSVNYTDDWEKQ